MVAMRLSENSLLDSNQLAGAIQFVSRSCDELENGIKRRVRLSEQFVDVVQQLGDIQMPDVN